MIAACRSLALLALAWLCVAASCTGAPSRIIVVVHTDFAVPSELDEIVVRVATAGVGPGADLHPASASALPLSLVVARDDGGQGPLVVDVEGRSRGSLVVRRTVRAAFLAHETHALDVYLLVECENATCGDESLTCASACVGGCMGGWICDDGTTALRTVDRPGDELDAGTRREDAGLLDAPTIVPDAGPFPRSPTPLAPHRGASIAAPGGRASRVRMRWTPLAQATRYEVQLTSRCVMGPCGVGDSPAFDAGYTLSTPVPLLVPDQDFITGPARFHWRVRGCDSLDDACSPWSESRYFDLGRLRDDMNADGISDIAIAGSSAGGVTDTLVVVDGATHDVLTRFTVPDLGPSDPRSLGLGIRLADVTGDGHAELIAVLCRGTTCMGSGADLLVLDGSTPTPMGSSALPMLVSIDASLSEASIVDVGDFDGDGTRDLVLVSATSYGFVHGATMLPLAAPTALDVVGPPTSLPSGDCDVDADGLVDLVWPMGTNVLVVTQAPAPGATLGAPAPIGAAACGDRNGDDVADVVVSVGMAEGMLVDFITDPLTGEHRTPTMPSGVHVGMGESLLFVSGAGSATLVVRGPDGSLNESDPLSMRFPLVVGAPMPSMGALVAVQALVGADGVLASAIAVATPDAASGGTVHLLGTTAPIATLEGSTFGLVSFGSLLARADRATPRLAIHAILLGARAS